MKDVDYDFWLCSIDGIGIKRLEILIRSLKTPENVYHAPEERLRKIDGISKRDVHNIVESRKEYDEIRMKEELKKYDMKCATYFSDYYPETCRHIYNPPKRLFYRGKMPEKGIHLAVVGARNCSHYGKENARWFSACLAANGISIISGMARGIDGWAHQGALEGGGYTYAVLGNSVEICYPREHEKLYQSIWKHGGILSEYAPGTVAAPGFFPMRNRIISALSEGVLVIEAREKSGSLITAEQALEQGKDIFVIPGRVGDELSEGCNNLIKQGAFLVTSPEEILKFYGLVYEKNTKNSRNINIFLESDEKMVYASLSLEPKHLNVLAEELKMEPAEVMKRLFSLQRNHLIKEMGNHYYIKNVI